MDLHEKIADLQQKLDAAEKERDAATLEYDVLNDQIKYWHEQAKAMATECSQYKALALNFSERADDYKSDNLGFAIFESRKEFEEYLPTPATDAFLNTVRAEGVELLAKRFDLDGGLAASHVAKQMREFAKQLRAGDADKDVSHA